MSFKSLSNNNNNKLYKHRVTGRATVWRAVSRSRGPLPPLSRWRRGSSQPGGGLRPVTLRAKTRQPGQTHSVTLLCHPVMR